MHRRVGLRIASIRQRASLSIERESKTPVSQFSERHRALRFHADSANFDPPSHVLEIEMLITGAARYRAGLAPIVRRHQNKDTLRHCKTRKATTQNTDVYELNGIVLLCSNRTFWYRPSVSFSFLRLTESNESSRTEARGTGSHSVHHQ